MNDIRVKLHYLKDRGLTNEAIYEKVKGEISKEQTYMLLREYRLELQKERAKDVRWHYHNTQLSLREIAKKFEVSVFTVNAVIKRNPPYNFEVDLSDGNFG